MTSHAPVERLCTQVCVPPSSQMMSLSSYWAPHWKSEVQDSPSFAAGRHVPVFPSSEGTHVSPGAHDGPGAPVHAAPVAAMSMPHRAGAGPPRQLSPGAYWTGIPQASPAAAPGGTVIWQVPDPQSPDPCIGTAAQYWSAGQSSFARQAPAGTGVHLPSHDSVETMRQIESLAHSTSSVQALPSDRVPENTIVHDSGREAPASK
jgi:hypothetical protein